MKYAHKSLPIILMETGTFAKLGKYNNIWYSLSLIIPQFSNTNFHKNLICYSFQISFINLNTYSVQFLNVPTLFLRFPPTQVLFLSVFETSCISWLITFQLISAKVENSLWSAIRQRFLWIKQQFHWIKSPYKYLLRSMFCHTLVHLIATVADATKKDKPSGSGYRRKP